MEKQISPVSASQFTMRCLIIFATILLFGSITHVHSFEACQMGEWSRDNPVCDWLNSSACALVDHRQCSPNDKYDCRCGDTLRPTNSSRQLQLCPVIHCPVSSHWGRWGAWSRYQNSLYACIRTRECHVGGHYSYSWMGCKTMRRGRQLYVSNRKLRCQSSGGKVSVISNYGRYIMGSIILLVALFAIVALCKVKLRGKNIITNVVHGYRSRRARSRRGESNDNSSQNEDEFRPPIYSVAISVSNAKSASALSNDPPPEYEGCASQNDADQLPAYDEVITDGKINSAYIKE